MKLRLLAAAAALMVLPACAESEDTAESEPAETSEAPTPEPEPEPSRCVEVSPEYVAFLNEQLAEGTSITEAAAVKSKDYEKVWMIAAPLEGPADGNVGIFATNGDPSGSDISAIFATDPFAKDFSDWPQNDDLVTHTADGAQEAADCLS